MVICLVVAGSLLGNSFVAGRMTVAAARAGWLPPVLSVLGRLGANPTTAHEEDEAAPLVDSDSASAVAAPAESDAPINALVLSTILSALYILLGNFRALLTFNGLGEYTFFFLTVVGAILLRYREPELDRPYKPSVLIPIIFALVSGFVVVRGAAFAPVQALVLLGVWGLGLAFYWAQKWLAGRNGGLSAGGI